MRALVGLLVLGALFWLATAWQERIAEDLRRERDHLRGTAGVAEAGWSTLVIGRPSGARRRRQDRGWVAAPADRLSLEQPVAVEAAFEELPYPAEHIVERNEVLGTICQGHYGAERGSFGNLAELTLAVAHFNGLQTPNAIFEGQVLLLPDLRELGDDTSVDESGSDSTSAD